MCFKWSASRECGELFLPRFNQDDQLLYKCEGKNLSLLSLELLIKNMKTYTSTTLNQLFYLKNCDVYCAKLLGPNSIRHCTLANIKQWLTSTGYRPCKTLYFASAYRSSIIFWSLKKIFHYNKYLFNLLYTRIY